MRKVTVHDIAKKLAVSPATVTRALNNLPKVGAEKRELIIKTAAEMGYSPNLVATSLSRKQICIEAVIFGAIPEFYNKLIEGIDAAYTELRDFNVEMNMHVLDKSKHSEKMLCNLLDALNSQTTNAVLIYSVSDTKEISQAVDRLLLAKIPVMVVNSDISTAQPHNCVRPDGEMAGRMAAEILNWITAKKNIFFFMGDRNTGILRRNNAGFLKESEDRGFNIVGRFYDDGSAEKAIRYFEEFIADGANRVDGIYINSAVSNAICNELYQRNLLEKYHIVASDLGKGIVEYIRNRQIPATIFQNPFKQGFEGLERIYKIVEGHKDIENAMLVNPIIICKSNVDFYSRFL